MTITGGTVKTKKQKTWIHSCTGKTDRWWLKRIGDLISENSNHETRVTDVRAWSGHLLYEVVGAIESVKIPKGRDENMIHASVLSCILMKWFVRLVRAKSYDGRRPLKHRKAMMKRLNAFCREVVGFMTDESEDHLHFPAQKWDPPFVPGAKNGVFK